MTAPCPECARLRALISQALKVIRRQAGGVVSQVKRLLEEGLA
jgi:hypothetical protein